MVARLVPLDDGPPITVERPIVFVGRHQDCDVHIDSKKISRRHCCFVQLHDRLVIRDLGSTNGIFCNGQRVDEAVLRPNDEVQIGNLRYQLVVDDLRSKPVAGARRGVNGSNGSALDEREAAPPADPDED